MKTVDLHVHSTFSDGTLTPTELVLKAQEIGLSAMALTDHDTIDGVSEAIEAGKNTTLEIVPGVELSTFYHEKEIHIVGLYLDYTAKNLNDSLEQFRTTREKRNYEICEKFHQIGIPIDYREMQDLYPNAVITRAHFADYLLKKGFIHSKNEAFDRYIGSNGPCFVPRKKVLPSDAIDMIHDAGGVAILAHPVLYHLGNEQMNALLTYLCESGLDGMEAIYSTYTAGEEIQMRNLAKRYHLIISGGSDYHGSNKPYLQLGTGRGHLVVPYDVLVGIQNARPTSKRAENS